MLPAITTIVLLIFIAYLPSTVRSSKATIKWNNQWHFLGPFSVGKTEIDGDPLFAPALKNIFSANETFNYKALPQSIFSEIVTGGYIKSWSVLQETSRNGDVQVDITSLSAVTVNLQNLVQLSSSITIQEFQGLLSRSLKVTKNGMYSITCQGLHTIEIDNHLYHADIYSSRQIYAVTYLRIGLHHVVSRIRGKGSARFYCSLSGPHSNHVQIYAPPAQELPDIVNGHLLTSYIGLRVINFSKKPLSKWNFKTNNKDVKVIIPSLSKSMKCYTGQTLALPLQIQLNGQHLKNKLNPGEKDVCLQFSLFIDSENIFSNKVKITLRCRRKDQSQLMTFLSHDGTVASAAFLRPRSNCQNKNGCPVILALSGVGVMPTNMADSFKFKAFPNEKDYTFGLPNAWILAPERDGAHNFEGTGHHTARSSLKALQSISFHDDTNKVDVSRILYVGHSRGGHGALVFATHRPDNACGVFSSNGWIRREYYADANPIFDHDLQLSHADSNVIRRVFESSIIENDVSISAVNMIGMPTLLRTSSDDHSVSPWFFRRFARILKTYEYENDQINEKQGNLNTVQFDELTSGGKGHWWWNSKKTNDGGVMFDMKVRSFFKKTLHQCNDINRRSSEIPSKFQVVSLNPSTFESHHGFRIEQFDVPFRLAKLYVQIMKAEDKKKQQFYIQSTNVRSFSITFNITKQSIIMIDGQKIRMSKSAATAPPIHRFVREHKEWKLTTKNIPLNERRPGTTGPMRQVFDRPFIIIPNSTVTLPLAIMLANSHFAGSKTTAPIYLPGEVDQNMKEHYNMIFIGKSDLRNEMVMGNLPLHFPININEDDDGNSHFSVESCTFKSGDHAGFVFLAPTTTKYNDKQLALIIDATDYVDLVDLFRGSYSSNVPLTRAMFTNMYPDFIITNGDEFRWKGLGGLHMSGYFNYHWGISDVMSSITCKL